MWVGVWDAVRYVVLHDVDMACFFRPQTALVAALLVGLTSPPLRHCCAVGEVLGRCIFANARRTAGSEVLKTFFDFFFSHENHTPF